MLIIANRGQEIASTNFWSSEEASAGMAYLSWNAGAARLLVPPSLVRDLPSMAAARHVIITFGKWREQHDGDAYEVLFEDNSDEPYCLLIVSEQSDRKLPASANGVRFPFFIWTAAGCQHQRPGYYRLGPIPCLEPLPKHVRLHRGG
jgi:hypothetical protein